MKKLLQLMLLFACVFALQSASAQCSDLFISEYVEGWNNNKALELYNPTDVPIDLSDYRLIRWNNGNTSYLDQAQVELSGTIQPLDTYVFVIDKQDCSSEGIDTCAWVGLQARADDFLCPDYNVCYVLYHNGNDAISLNKISENSQFPFGAFVDIFGLIGEDPGVSWTDTFPYVESAGGTWWSRNRTLIRKPDVMSGETMNPGTPYTGAWDPTVQWDTLANNTFDNLGWHECVCGGNVGIEDNVAASHIMQLYPNPTTGILTITTNKVVEKIEVYNMVGQAVQTENMSGYLVNVQLNMDLPKGQYLVKVTYQDGLSDFEKIVRQ